MDRRRIIVRRKAPTSVWSFIVAPVALSLALSGCGGVDADIAVRQDATEITADFEYDFGEVEIGESGEVIFTIGNDAFYDDLELIGGTPITINNSVSFMLSDPAVSPIPPDGSSTFAVVFEPIGVPGENSGLVSISSNDPDESPFEFWVVGTAIDPISSSYIVTYSANGANAGSVPSDSSNYEQGQVVTVLGNTGSLVRTGYNFAGWNSAADGNGVAYAAATTFSMGSADVTLYAIWTTNPVYSVIYNGNGNTGGTVPIDLGTYEQGQSVTVLDNTFGLLKTDNLFTGWNTTTDGSGSTYSMGQTVTVGIADVILYAEWWAVPTVSGTYTGSMSGTVYGSPYAGTLTITLTQNQDSVSGSYTSDVGSSGTVSITLVPNTTADLTAFQASPCSGTFIGWASVEESGDRITGSHSGTDCGGTVTTTFDVTRL